MFEEASDGFMTRWRRHAAQVRVFSRTEGCPLLEFEAAGSILQALERTGPYLTAPGEARVIVNPTAISLELVHGQQVAQAAPAQENTLQVGDGRHKLLEPISIGSLRACGPVLLRDSPFVVVDAGVPLVVGVQHELDERIREGVWVRFESLAPIHAFVLPAPRASRLPEADGDQL